MGVDYLFGPSSGIVLKILLQILVNELRVVCIELRLHRGDALVDKRPDDAVVVSRVFDQRLGVIFHHTELLLGVSN